MTDQYKRVEIEPIQAPFQLEIHNLISLYESRGEFVLKKMDKISAIHERKRIGGQIQSRSYLIEQQLSEIRRILFGIGANSPDHLTCVRKIRVNAKRFLVISDGL